MHCVVLVRDLASLLLDNQAFLLESFHVKILVLELVLNRFLLSLQRLNLLIQLVEFDLLSLDFLVIVG